MISQQIYLKKMSYVPEFVALYEIIPYIRKWGVSKANNTRYMFRGAKSFNPENAPWYDDANYSDEPDDSGDE